jgi:hypothetical protein
VAQASRPVLELGGVPGPLPAGNDHLCDLAPVLSPNIIASREDFLQGNQETRNHRNNFVVSWFPY